MSLADFMQELQTQDNIIYSQPPESAIHVIPPEKVCTNIIPPKDLGQKPPTTIKLKIKQKNVTTDVPKAESSTGIIVEPPAQPSTVIDLSKTNSIVKKPPSQSSQRPPQQPITRQPNNQPINRASNSQPNMQPNSRPPTNQPISRPVNQPINRPNTNQPINRPNTQVASNRPIGPNVPTRPVGPVKPAEATKSTEAIPQRVQSANLTDEEIFFKSGTESSKHDIWMGYFNRAKTSKKSNPIVDRMRLGRFTITPDNKVLLLPDYDIVGKDPDDVLKDKWF